MHRELLLILLICCTLPTACSRGKDSPLGFSLPAGDPEAGKAAFVSLQCNACHSTDDIEQLPVVAADAVSVHLGGDVSRVKTYAELVTSVINPSHRLSPGYHPRMTAPGELSPMRNYNDAMTVTQLINLVSYLQPLYQLKPHMPSTYPVYYP